MRQHITKRYIMSSSHSTIQHTKQSPFSRSSYLGTRWIGHSRWCWRVRLPHSGRR